MTARVRCALLFFCLATTALYGDEKAPPAPSTPAVVADADKYLSETGSKAQRGTERYYAVAALEQAVKAFKEGNYGIGAVVLLKWKNKLYEFRDRNAMLTGYGLRDHAEARALDRAVAVLAGLKGKKIVTSEGDARRSVASDDSYAPDTPFLNSLPDGLHVYGTLEPCPMCMVMMLNVGVKSSKSLAKDGDLKKIDGMYVSDGAALATEEKFKGAPLIWQSIRKQQGLEFVLYQEDKRLAELGLRIFLETRKQIDELLGGQGKD